MWAGGTRFGGYPIPVRGAVALHGEGLGGASVGPGGAAPEEAGPGEVPTCGNVNPHFVQNSPPSGLSSPQ